MIPAFLKKKLVVQENNIKLNEDFKTSSSIGIMQYLPDDIFWDIIRNSCVGFNENDEFLGKIQAFNFWAHTDSHDTTNTNYVEPDVWIETDKCDIIIEAKVSDISGQYEGQWENEIQSILNERGENAKIILIALGGNENMFEGNVLGFNVYKASWYDLLNSLVKEREKHNENDFVCRIIDDVIELFARQGLMRIHWLGTMPIEEIDDQAINTWAEIKELTGFSLLKTDIINEYILQKWQPIN